MIKNENNTKVEQSDIRLELLQQQKGDMLFLKQNGVDTSVFEELIDEMMNDEYTIRSHYLARA